MDYKDITKQVFLSYVRKDNAVAEALVKELQQLSIKVWYSKKDISAGESSSETIEKALKGSDSMIAILNEYSFSSSYVRNELQHAFFDDRYKDRLLPVLLGAATSTDFVRLPWVLTKMPYLKITKQKSTESIAKAIVSKFIALLNKKEGN